MRLHYVFEVYLFSIKSKRYCNNMFFNLGIGVAMTRDPATLMIGQYFKRKREFVEIILVSGSGLGIATMSVFIRMAIR